MRPRSVRFAILCLGAVVTMVAGCSTGGRKGGGATTMSKVPLDLVPPQLSGQSGDLPLTLAEYPQGAQRLDTAGGRSVIADGRVFEIRRGTTLVGALQISTLLPRVDLTSAKERDKLAGLMVSGDTQKITVSGVDVIVAKTSDKVVFVWFGDQLFEVLQIKGAGIDPQTMLSSIIDYQRPTGHLRIRKTAASS